ncbi:hypothetical protein ACXZ66_11440 [Corynebacterium sp. S7]
MTNPYYAGVIRYKGALYPDAHDSIVEPALFDKVQSLLKARRAKMIRHVQHAPTSKICCIVAPAGRGCCSTSPPTRAARPTPLHLLRESRKENKLHEASCASCC